MKKQEGITGKILMQDNQIARRIYKLPSQHNKVYLRLLYEAQKEYARREIEWKDENTYPVVLVFTDLWEAIELPRKRRYGEVLRMVSEIRGTPIHRGESTEEPLIAGVEGDKDGLITVSFSGNLLRQLTELTSFTAINLTIINTLPSFKSQRLYELLRFWSQPKEYRFSQEYSVGMLKELLGVGEKYKEYKEFKRNILLKAVKEINENTNMSVEIQEIKHRVNQVRVEKIKFRLYDEEPRVYGKKKRETRKNSIAEEEAKIVGNKNNIPEGLACSKQVCAKMKEDEQLAFDFVGDPWMNAVLLETIKRTLKQLEIDKVTMRQYGYMKAVIINLKDNSRLNLYNEKKEKVGKCFIDERKRELLKKKMEFGGPSWKR